MKHVGLAVCSIAAALMLGAGARAQAPGENPPGVNPEHYLCYRVAGQTRPVPIKWKDQFATGEARVMQPVFLCNPVQKNNQEIKDEKTHLVCFQLSTQRPSNKRVVVQNQFGKQQLRVANPQLLCVPSLKEEVK
jgi:hypothetical protein